MSRGRGIQCSDCDLKIDRYDDSIKCLKCKNNYHSKCVFPSMENYLKLRDENKLNQWICETCIQRPVFSESDVSTQLNLDDTEGTGDVENSKPMPNPRPSLSCQHSINDCLNKNDLLKLKQEIVEDVTRLFASEIVSLKEMLVAQEKLIRDLLSEKNELKQRKNVYKTNRSGNKKPHCPPGVLSASIRVDSVGEVSPGDPCSTDFIQEKIMDDLIYIEGDVESVDDAKSTGAKNQSESTLIKSKRGVKANKLSVGIVDTMDGKSISTRKLHNENNKTTRSVDGSKISVANCSGDGNDVLVDENSSHLAAEWKMVSSKNRKRTPRKPLVVGNFAGSATVEGIVKYKALHVTNLKLSTSVADLVKFLQTNFTDVKCEALKSRYPESYASFKVLIPYDEYDKIKMESNWPKGCSVHNFYQRKKTYQTS